MLTQRTARCRPQSPACFYTIHCKYIQTLVPLIGCRAYVEHISDRRFLPDGVEHATPLFPFWGEPNDYDAYTRFAAWARDNWRLTALEDAQIAALPFDGGEIVGRTREASIIDLAQRFVDLAAGAGLRTLVVVNHDAIDPLPVSGPMVVLRTSLDRHTRAPGSSRFPPGTKTLSTPTLVDASHSASTGQGRS